MCFGKWVGGEWTHTRTHTPPTHIHSLSFSFSPSHPHTLSLTHTPIFNRYLPVPTAQVYWHRLQQGSLVLDKTEGEIINQVGGGGMF